MVCAVANKETDYTAVDVDNLALLMQGVWSHIRKRNADEALRQKTTDLEAAFEEITATDEELRANYEEIAATQKALSESERKYRNLYHYAQVGLFETSFKDGTIVACNQQYADLAGFTSVEDAIGKDILPLYVNPEDRTEVGRILRETGFIENHVVKFRNQRTGKLFWGQFSARFNYEREVAEGTIIDITVQKETEDALRESERRLQESQAMAHLGFWYWDVKTGDVEWSDEVFRIFGLDPKTFTPHIDSILALSPGPEDHQRDRELIQRAMESREPGSYEQRFLRPDNSTGYYYSTFEGRYDKGGNLVLIVGTVLDITGRKIAEAALAAAQQQYRELFENVSIGILRSTPGPEGTLLEANPAALRIFEAESREQFFAVRPSDLYYDSDQRRRISDEIVAKGSITGMEVKYKTLLGRAFWGRITSIKKVSETGQIYFDNTIEDITGRKQAEEDLKASEEKFSTAFKTSPYAITITRITDGRFIEVNDAFTPITGFTREEATAGSSVGFGLWVDPEDRKRVITALLDSSTVNGEEFLFRRKNGEFITVLFSARIISLNNEPCILSSINDITDRKRVEAEMRVSEKRYRRLFESAKDGILILNRDTGKIIDANPFIETLLGYAPTDLLGKYLWDIGLFKDQLLSKIAFEELQAKEYLRYDDLPLETLDGKKKEVEFVSNVYPVDAKTSVIQCNIRDITDRKRTQEALRETNEYLQNLFNYANAPIIVWDPQFRITRFNHAFEILTGRTEEEVLGQYLEILFPEASRDVSLEHIRRAVRGERWETVEIPILHVSGQTRIVLWNSASIVDPQGTLTSTIAQGYDITDRKVAVDALRQSEEKYRVLFTRMTEGSALHEMVYDPAGNPADYRILDVNPAFESVLGIKRETVVGKTSCEAYGVAPPPYLDIYARVAATGQPFLFEEFFEPMQKHFSISVFSPEQGRFATIFEDITERKQAEELRERLIRELEQKNAELERFTYTVSHDLKSPLITIKGFAGLLEDDTIKKDPVQLKKDVQRIISAADTMQELLADVLELSRVGRVISLPENTSFGTIAKEAVDLLAGPLAERGVWIEVAPDLPVVRVDRARIREVMVNLVENAVKFIGSQQNPVIRIGVETDGTTPVFFVQDNGIGIDPRYLERIFNLFERLDTSTHGTGIGLTIVRRIIETHGGRIWAESEGPGKGTTFKFTLPGGTAGGDDRS